MTARTIPRRIVTHRFALAPSRPYAWTDGRTYTPPLSTSPGAALVGRSGILCAYRSRVPKAGTV